MERESANEIFDVDRDNRVKNDPVQRNGIGKFSVAVFGERQAAAGSSAASYFLLKRAGFRHSLGIAHLIFGGGLAVTAHRWNAEGKEYLLKRYHEIPKTIREKRREKERGEEGGMD